MTVAVSTMIINSLISNGERSIGDTLTSTEGVFYLGKLNAMLESWSLDRRMCYAVSQVSSALTASTGTYTIGTGGAFNTDRPTKILKAFVRDSSSSDSEVKVVPYDAYDSIIQKNVAGSYPTVLYYDQSYGATGLATIYLSPLPIGGLTLYLDTAKLLQNFTNVSNSLLMPPGYQRAIESNFCIETAPGLRTLGPEIIKIAKESKAAVMGVNLPETVSRMDSGIVKRSTGSILTGP